MANPIADAVAFMTADTADFATLAAARYVVVIVFYLLVIATLTLCVVNLRDDKGAAQR